MHSLLHTWRGGEGGGERERVFLFPIYCAFHLLHTATRTHTRTRVHAHTYTHIAAEGDLHWNLERVLSSSVFLLSAGSKTAGASLSLSLALALSRSRSRSLAIRFLLSLSLSLSLTHTHYLQEARSTSQNIF